MTSSLMPRSGEQHHIRFDDQVATVTGVGATLRRYSVDGADVIDRFDEDEISPAGHGQVLAPWPNRLDHGEYTFSGRPARAALNEPERANAIHGLVRWLEWRRLSSSDSHVELECTLEPQPAYPWRLRMNISFSLDEHGLTVNTQVENQSDDVAPFGLGFHPYLTLDQRIDGLTLQVSASERLITDDRALPVGSKPLAGTLFDLRAPGRVGELKLDTAFGDLTRANDGRTVATIADDEGRSLALWVDDQFKWLMVFTGDALDDPARRRQAIAIEPMTCPPNALRTGADLVKLHPWTPWRAEWGISPSTHD